MNNIASERKRLNLNQNGLARELDVSPKTVSRWETEELFPYGQHLIKMHNLFGCSVDYLLGLSDERKATT